MVAGSISWCTNLGNAPDLSNSPVNIKCFSFPFNLNIYPTAYCPADKTYMDNVGFFAEAEGYPQMPIGDLSAYALKIGND